MYVITMDKPRRYYFWMGLIEMFLCFNFSEWLAFLLLPFWPVCHWKTILNWLICKINRKWSVYPASFVVLVTAVISISMQLYWRRCQKARQNWCMSTWCLIKSVLCSRKPKSVYALTMFDWFYTRTPKEQHQCWMDGPHDKHLTKTATLWLI